MEKITVSLGRCSYPITIGTGLLNTPEAFWPLKRGDNAMLITDNRLAPLYLDFLTRKLSQAGIKIHKIVLPDGEQNKSLKILNCIFNALLTKFHSRDTTIIAFGGGVIGDLAGFAAATYQRGVRFIQIPTTLLSQVDSSIGGKTAINHPLGKNMIGAFHQPASVIIDLDFLSTLSQREISSGLAEVIKYGIIFDAEFFSWIEKNLDALLNLKPLALSYCIRRCCELKANVVATDEREQGQRMLLNFGHTYGHAIENYMGYGRWLHGEAIAVGIMIAVRIARRLGRFSIKDSNRISTLLLRARLPVSGPIEMTEKDYLLNAARDKKIISGKLNLVLPVELGKAEIHPDVDSDIIIASINASRAS